jgi:hypothetical protein
VREKGVRERIQKEEENIPGCNPSSSKVHGARVEEDRPARAGHLPRGLAEVRARRAPECVPLCAAAAPRPARRLGRRHRSGHGRRVGAGLLHLLTAAVGERGHDVCCGVREGVGIAVSAAKTQPHLPAPPHSRPRTHPHEQFLHAFLVGAHPASPAEGAVAVASSPSSSAFSSTRSPSAAAAAAPQATCTTEEEATPVADARAAEEGASEAAAFLKESLEAAAGDQVGFWKAPGWPEGSATKPARTAAPPRPAAAAPDAVSEPPGRRAAKSWATRPSCLRWTRARCFGEGERNPSRKMRTERGRTGGKNGGGGGKSRCSARTGKRRPRRRPPR